MTDQAERRFIPGVRVAEHRTAAFARNEAHFGEAAAARWDQHLARIERNGELRNRRLHDPDAQRQHRAIFQLVAKRVAARQRIPFGRDPPPAQHAAARARIQHAGENERRQQNGDDR
jgi:hypothetical protein